MTIFCNLIKWLDSKSKVCYFIILVSFFNFWRNWPSAQTKLTFFLSSSFSFPLGSSDSSVRRKRKTSHSCQYWLNEKDALPWLANSRIEKIRGENVERKKKKWLGLETTFSSTKSHIDLCCLYTLAMQKYSRNWKLLCVRVSEKIYGLDGPYTVWNVDALNRWPQFSTKLAVCFVKLTRDDYVVVFGGPNWGNVKWMRKLARKIPFQMQDCPAFLKSHLTLPVLCLF